jgi:hypothetical protein
METRKVKQVQSGGLFQWEGGRDKESVKKAECSGNIMYENGKMRPVETMERGIKENDGGVIQL